MKVLGVIIKQGEFNGNAYDNVMLHCSYKDDNGLGMLTEVVKIKHSLVDEVFGKHMDAGEYQKLIGKDVRVNYNRYGIVNSVDLIS